MANFKRIQRLEIEYSSLKTSSQRLERLPKTLKHLRLYNIYLYDVTFLSDLSSLTSLELLEISISNSAIAYIADHCLKLESLKIHGKF